MDVNQNNAGDPQGQAGQPSQNAGSDAPAVTGDPAGTTAQGMLIDAGDEKSKPGLLNEIEDDIKKGLKSIKVRVLRLCEHGQPNDVVSLAPRAAKAAEKAGDVDSHPDAVAYAESLKTPDAP